MFKKVDDPLQAIVAGFAKAEALTRQQAESQKKMADAAIALRDVVREQAAIMATIAARMEVVTRKAEQMAKDAACLVRRQADKPSIPPEQEADLELATQVIRDGTALVLN